MSENIFETELTPDLEIEGIAKRPQNRLFDGVYELLRTFSPSERLLLYALSLALAAGSFLLLAGLNESVSTEVPTQGGSLVEGATGIARFVNPLLASSVPDHDLATLIYSGLLRAEPNGYVPDLAESYDISADGTTYTFHLRENLTFHDGKPLTAQDIAFTVSLAQNPEIKSARRADWEGVEISTPDLRTVIFTLPHAYAPFLENATLGILPQHLWEHVPASEFPFSSLNSHPVGSGPYSLKDLELDETGAAVEYRLVAFPDFALGAPHLRRITYRIFPNDEALFAAYEEGAIESFVASMPKTLPQKLRESADVRTATLARSFGVFFNQNHAPVLASLPVRRALIAAIDKEDIIRDVLGGFGVPIDSPIPPGIIASGTSTASPDTASAILEKAGWTFASSTASSTPGGWRKEKQVLSLTLATADTEELVATASRVKEAWEALGVPTKVEIYPLQEFNQSVLRPRNYDGILFGEVVGRSLDLFAFWHSSQRSDPGLNLALYTSPDADTLLARAREEIEEEKRIEHLRSFVEEIAKDAPAVFLYSPSLAYALPESVQGAELGTLTSPGERFLTVYRWYRDTEKVWNFFTAEPLGKPSI